MQNLPKLVQNLPQRLFIPFFQGNGIKSKVLCYMVKNAAMILVTPLLIFAWRNTEEAFECAGEA